MGDRAGYRFKGTKKHDSTERHESAYLRKQYAIAETEEEFKRVIAGIASKLLNGEDVGSGMSALREDLNRTPGRGLQALIKAEGRLPFDTVTQDIPGDIRRIIEFDVSDPYNWEIRYIRESEFEEDSSGDIIAEVHFEPAKPLEEAMKFTWKGR